MFVIFFSAINKNGKRQAFSERKKEPFSENIINSKFSKHIFRPKYPWLSKKRHPKSLSRKVPFILKIRPSIFASSG